MLTAWVSAQHEAWQYGCAAARLTDPEAAEDARLLRDAALDLAEERLDLALGRDGGDR